MLAKQSLTTNKNRKRQQRKVTVDQRFQCAYCVVMSWHDVFYILGVRVISRCYRFHRGDQYYIVEKDAVIQGCFQAIFIPRFLSSPRDIVCLRLVGFCCRRCCMYYNRYNNKAFQNIAIIIINQNYLDRTQNPFKYKMGIYAAFKNVLAWQLISQQEY